MRNFGYLFIFAVTLWTGSLSHGAQRHKHDPEECFQIFLKAKQDQREAAEKAYAGKAKAKAQELAPGIKKLIGAACNTTKLDNVLTKENNTTLETTRDSIGKNLAMLAASKGAINVLEYLITKKVDFNYSDPNNNTLLRWAMNCPENTIVATVKKVLTIDKAVNNQDIKKGRTPLQWLLRRHEKAFAKQADQLKSETVHDVAQLLLNASADPMIRDKDEKRTALYWASSYDDKNLVKLLTTNAKNNCTILDELIAGAISSLHIQSYANLKASIHQYIQLIPDEKLDIACVINKAGCSTALKFPNAQACIQTITIDLVALYKSTLTPSPAIQPPNPLIQALQLLKLKLLQLAKKLQPA